MFTSNKVAPKENQGGHKAGEEEEPSARVSTQERKSKLAPRIRNISYPPINWSQYPLFTRIKGITMGVLNGHNYVSKLEMKSSNTKNSIKSFMSTLGLISALLLTMTYSSTLNPMSLDVTKYTSDPTVLPYTAPQNIQTVIRTANALAYSSFALSVCVLINVALFIIVVDLIATDHDLSDFLAKFSRVFSLIVGLFVMSLVSACGQVILACTVLLPSMDFIILISASCCLLAWAVYVTVFSLTFVGSRLWYRLTKQNERIKVTSMKTSLEQAMEQAVSHMNMFLEHKLDSELESILEDAVTNQFGELLGKVMEKTMQKTIKSVTSSEVEELVDKALAQETTTQALLISVVKGHEEIAREEIA